MSTGDRETYSRTHRSYGTADSGAGFFSRDAGERERAERERRARVEADRARAKDAPPPPPRDADHRRAEAAKVDELLDVRLVRRRITSPPTGAQRVHLFLVDNSGSNARIATHFRRSTGYTLAALGAIDPDSAFAAVYFSDHCDGADLKQEVGYVLPAEPEAEKILYSSTRQVRGADGGDEAEAMECVLWDTCELNFGHIPRERRHLYLVTDVVAHGMGLRSDEGCPLGRRWQDSVERVRETFATFQVVGCNDGASMGALQQKFLQPERRAWDLLDLSEIRSQEHRLAIALNSLLFLVARNRGEQVVRVFLMALYEKWLKEPIFGQDTDLRAREAIRRFMKFLDLPQETRDEMEARIFAE